MSLSVENRKSNIASMQADKFDLVIIGGGISGAGIARDAAMRGMKVALIEAQDFAAGTSSRSSKLIHGGIRYLENLEFGLVFEALKERQNLFEMAPHLVHPLRFMLPVYDGARVGMFKLGLGMWAYDALSSFEAPELHSRFNKADSLRQIPYLDPNGLVGSYVYSDAYMDDDRLVIETLRSAAGHGALLANYVRATGAEFQDGKISELVCRDEITKNEFHIRGSHFVSTVGPWTDLVANQLLSDWRSIMRPSKGVHLTFSRKRLPIDKAVVMISDDEKRIVFAIPRHEMVIIGTTDTDFKGDPANVKTTREDVDYLLHVTGNYFPGAKIKESDIIASYSGVRPLVDDGSATESKTSREHLIISDPRNISFVTGGKYTTYRQIAEDALEIILDNFSLEDKVRWGKCQTAQPLNRLATQESIFKARASSERWAAEFGLDVDTVNFLIERHGEEAGIIISRFAARAGTKDSARWRMEALHAIHQTMCLSLTDFYLRRVPLFLSNEDHGFLLLDELADLFKEELGWSKEEKLKSVAAVHNYLEHEMGWRESSKAGD